ncbi:MAG: ABC transporter ATP-binding protein [Inconstantimicrobium porci]|uniref:ABC transporter ATP-binding protein n=1 Tax=Inconstantimicrobium porci TaxID=2652291 RepID=UPI002A91DEA7|nr:ABC transporter ATP-binding protein [Inconstantimicrobium porci]MDY5910640.1 ABC transporter ATP-binding protein [Inconstantimicrobium porci]
MSIRKRISVTKRGFGILKKYCPGLVQGKALHEFINSVQPFISVWFSAHIINEIVTQKRIEKVILYVSLVVLINFICAFLKNIIERVCNEKESQMWCWFGKIFSDKQMSLDFVDLEDAKIQQQRQSAEENLYMFGNGLAQLVWGTSSLVRCFVNIVASVIMIVPLFISKSGNAFIDNPVWILILLASVTLGGFSNSKATIKENEVFMKWCEGTVWFNRAFMFFGKELYMSQERTKDVRIYQQNTIAEKVFDKLIQCDRENKTDIFKMSIYPAMASVIIGLANIVCYLFVALKAFFGAFGVGSIVQYVAVLLTFGQGIQQLMYVQADNAVYCTYLQKLFDYLDIPNNMYKGSLTVEKRDDNEYYIEFRNVSFKYPNAEDYALRNVNFKFKVGEKLAVVGMNGSGKSTFIKLMCRLYDPTEGEILLNGVNIQKYDYNEYMSIFSVVFQDFRLFSFSLAQNVATNMDYNADKVRSCLKKAGFKSHLSSLKNDIDVCLYKDFDTDGVEVSGGEAQKIALARALYKDAPFIILDEPTAALDPISEYEVYSKFNEIADNKTAIYISHRLASCRFCDVIAVFHEGAVIQNGTHEELLADSKGKYFELWNAQLQYYKRS